MSHLQTVSLDEAADVRSATRRTRSPAAAIDLDARHADASVRRSRGAVLVILSTVAAASVPWYASFGLSIAWPTVVPYAITTAGVFAIAWRISIGPRTHADRAIADTVLVAGLILLVTNVGAPAQYLAAALRRPLIDPWLAAADAFVGIDVGRLAGWTAGHPALGAVLQLAYASLLPQFLAAILLLGLLYKDRARLWEYCFHFHFCLLVTLAGLALAPAACAFQFLGFDSVLSQERFIAHFNGVRDGTFTTIRFDDLEGLISMPSFHVAGGMMVTWAFRGYRRPFAFLLVLNALMIASTFMTGAHYFMDVPGTFVMFCVSLAVHHSTTTRTNAGRG